MFYLGPMAYAVTLLFLNLADMRKADQALDECNYAEFTTMHNRVGRRLEKASKCQGVSIFFLLVIIFV